MKGTLFIDLLADLIRRSPGLHAATIFLAQTIAQALILQPRLHCLLSAMNGAVRTQNQHLRLIRAEIAVHFTFPAKYENRLSGLRSSRGVVERYVGITQIHFPAKSSHQHRASIFARVLNRSLQFVATWNIAAREVHN